MRSLKLGLTLALYAVACCTILALVNNITSPVIQENQRLKAEAGMRQVMSNAESFEEVQENLFVAKENEKIIGAVCKVSGPTYDKATILVGMTKDGIVTGISFLELTDSPGFGLKANDSTFTLSSGKTFYGQFEGMKASEGFEVGVTVDAISGATITSKGVASLVEKACKTMAVYFDNQK